MKIIRLLKHDLASEVWDWVRKGLLSEKQALAILESYGIGARQEKVSFSILSILAALFMGIGLILLMSHNWEDIPRAVRMLGLIALTASLFVLGVRAWCKEAFEKAQAWFLASSLSYGASIFLIAQIYHLGERYPDGVLFWILGVLPLGLLLNSLPIVLFAVGLGLFWFCYEMSLDYFCWGYVFILAAGFWFCLNRRQSLLIFMLNVSGFVLLIEAAIAWLRSSLVEDTHGVYVDMLDFGSEHFFLSLGLALVFYTLGDRMSQVRVENRFKDYGLLLKLWALRLGIFILAIMSFDSFWNHLPLHTGLLFFVLGLVVVAQGLLLFYRPWTRELSSGVFTISLCLLTGLMTVMQQDPIMPILCAGLVNVILFGIGVAFIQKGLQTQVRNSVMFGTLILLLLGFLRYIDLFGDYVGGSLLFFTEGFILLGVDYWVRNNMSDNQV